MRARAVAPLLALAVVAGGAVAVTPAAAATTAAATAAVQDRVVVTAPGYRLDRPVVSGRLAVNDDIGDYAAREVTADARLSNGAQVAVDLDRGLFGLAGTIKVTDGAAGVRLAATVSLGLTREGDDTLRWNGLATLTRGGKDELRFVTVTLVDAVPDPGDHAVTMRHAGQDRRAVVHVPASAPARGGPALAHFPGLFESPAIAEQFGKFRAHADAHGYLLVIPEHYGQGWQGVLAGTESPELDDPGFVRALMAEVVRRFGADGQRLYASGMSNGGFFTSLLGCRLSDVFAAFAPVAGQLNDPAGCAPSRPVPIAMIHGDADPLVPYTTVAPAEQFWTANNGCGGQKTSTPLPDTDPADGTTAIRHDHLGCAAPVVLFQVVGGGHAWPGGDEYPVGGLLGKPGRDLVANDAIWDFVSRFRLPR